MHANNILPQRKFFRVKKLLHIILLLSLIFGLFSLPTASAQTTTLINASFNSDSEGFSDRRAAVRHAEISSSQVSRAAASLDETQESWRNRPLGIFPYVYLGARYE